MSFKRIPVLSLCLMLVPLAACTFSAETGDTVRQPAIEAPDMDAYWAAHVAHRQSGDVEAAIGILAEDCVLYEPFRPPVSGLDNIAPKFKQALEMAETHELSFDSREVYHHGSWLVDLGTFSEVFSLAGSEDRHVVEGSYTAFLAQEAGGDWKVKRFMVLPSTPPPGEPTG